jgi:magnesium chelatase family protein
MEEGCVTIARASRTVVFPARFTLVGAMNPCPCGYHGDERHPCRCTPLQVERYRARLSGPLRDRIDLIVDVPAVPAAVIGDAAPGEASATVRERVLAARVRQAARHAGTPWRTNADLASEALRRYCQPTVAGRTILRSAMERLGLSARSYGRTLKVARTVADLALAEVIDAEHVAEALHYR